MANSPRKMVLAKFWSCLLLTNCMPSTWEFQPSKVPTSRRFCVLTQLELCLCALLIVSASVHCSLCLPLCSAHYVCLVLIFQSPFLAMRMSFSALTIYASIRPSTVMATRTVWMAVMSPPLVVRIPPYQTDSSWDVVKTSWFSVMHCDVW